jgi:hypothetical protein
MDIKDIREAKTVLEHEILRFLQTKTQEFRGKTGESVSDLSVTFHHFQAVGSADDDYRISGVSARVVL